MIIVRRYYIGKGRTCKHGQKGKGDMATSKKDYIAIAAILKAEGDKAREARKPEDKVPPFRGTIEYGKF